jgi:intracellular protein transport protein USO1
MLRILESQAPAKQTATDTINILSSRLQSATLLEDRRAAILGLRSFAKLYPASVASGALRDLIACLRRDGDDLDTIKVVLETLLMLFDPDKKSAEASDEIALWLADEFTQRQDNITALLDLLELKDFYPRLYSLQLISRIAAARPERTQDSIFTAPLGVSRLVAILDDKREAARNEALLLLIVLSPSSPELQKVVAFENAFDRIFALVEAEGSLTHGSMTIQDCLTLLANLLKLNVSNQSYFREIGCVSKLARLLAGVSEEEESEDGVSDWARPQRDMNVWGLLAIVQLFLSPGAQGTPLNQSAFWKSGIVLQVLHLAFSSTFGVSIRAKALSACADLIRGNTDLQEKFGDLFVPKGPVEAPKAALDEPLTNGHPTTNVIEALLKLTLEAAPPSLFDVRLAACECVKSFFTGHPGISAHVLRRAIEGHKSGEDEIPNILTVLINPPNSRTTPDPYQTWMASVLMFHLLYEESDAKVVALGVSEGNAADGEEVITFVQSIAGNVISGYQQQDDERILVGYLMLLCGWLFEDPDAVNDFLGEGSCVPSLIQATKVSSHNMPLAAGLGTFLLGIVYEFSTKDSPVPRTMLHTLLVSGLGREVYIDKLTKLRENPLVRDFEVLSQGARDTLEGGLPNVFLDKTFVEFLKDQFSRILRAIDRDPGFEVSVMSNGVQKGISRELVDSLRAQLEEKANTLRNLESEMVLLNRKIEQEELDHRRTKESSAVENARIKQINESLHKHHDQELETLKQEFSHQQGRKVGEYEEQLRKADELLKQTLAENEEKSTKTRERNEAEIGELKDRVQQLEARLQKADKDHIQDLQTAHEEYVSKEGTLQGRMKRAEEKVEELEDMIKTIKTALEGARSERDSLKLRVEEKEMARRDAQTELDDLLIVFGDLEAKRTQDKKRLKALGDDVSEWEESDEDGGLDAVEEEDIEESGIAEHDHRPVSPST